MRRVIVFFKNIISLPYRLLFTKISIFARLQDCKVDRKSAICKGTRFYRSELGKYSYIGNNTFVTNTYIGKFTSISGNCYIGATSHPIQWVSTSPVFHKWDNILRKHFAKLDFEVFSQSHIGNDVWIGEGCKIKAGVTIGDGAVIGMGSVVTKDVGPYEIWAGNPAKLIRKRFDEAIIEKLLRIKWWDFDETQLKQYAEHFDTPLKFIEQYEKQK